MKTMKKVISALLLVCMLMSLCAVGAYAEGEATYDFSINNSSITLDLNTANTGANTATMSVNVVPAVDAGVAWSWTPNDTSVVTATGAGEITAVAVGNTTVTGKISRDGTELASATANVSVVDTTLNSASISGDSSVPYDGTTALELTGSAVANDNSNLTGDAIKKWEWTSDNTAVTVTGSGSTASVKSSTPGATANITLKVTDKYGQSKTSSTFPVTVASAPAEPTVTYKGVAINYDSKGGFTAIPEFEGTPDESKISYSWTCDSVDNVVASGNGTKYLTLTNNNTEQKTLNVKVKATYDGTSKEATGSYTLPAKSTAKTMTLRVNSSELFAGGNTYTLSALDDGVAITDKPVTYSIKSGPATVSGSTLITGEYGGTVVVSASCDGYTLASDLTLTVKDGITLKATPDTLTIGSSTTSQLTAYYNGKTEAISGVTWKEVNTSGANVATLNASTGVVTAGSAAGTVKYHAVIGGQEITSVDVTVTVRANNIIEFDVAGFYNSVSSFTVTAKGGVLQLVASNARLKSNPSVSIPGTFNFNWVPATGDPSNGIEVTNLGSGKATAYGRYNGSYSLAVTFTPNDTATYPVTTQNHTVIVNYTPSIIKGNYGVWDGTNGLDFLINDHISNWSGQVWVDGNLLSDANYVCRGSSDGQIWVTLTPAFISWLRQYYNGNGIHTITVGVDGRNAATGYFKTWGTASSFNGVKTGDDANLGLWAALLGVSAVGAAAAVVIYKRKKANG